MGRPDETGEGLRADLRERDVLGPQVVGEPLAEAEAEPARLAVDDDARQAGAGEVGRGAVGAGTVAAGAMRNGTGMNSEVRL